MKLHYRYSSDLTVLVLDGTAHGAMAERKYVDGERSTLRGYQTWGRQATNETRKEGLKNHADVTVCVIASYAKLDWC